MIIRVDDYGSGMDRAIIDNKLTRLFASDKEDDLTKIGKFGIGFVSVFALKPDAVCLDTGRVGESWRVLFRSDRTFTRIRLREPVEGTKIQVIKKVSRAEYSELAPQVKKALRFHCKHVDIALRYGGELVSEPLDLEALLKVAEQSGTIAAVVGITRPEQPELGRYYNRGLTLLEEKSPIPRVTFKVNSPHLEHTLSRDNVIRDENYQAALELVEKVLRGPLFTALLQALDATLRDPSKEAAAEIYQSALGALLLEKILPPPECQELAVASGPDGQLYPLLRLQTAASLGKLVHASATSPLVSELLAQEGAVVVPGQAPLVAAIYEAKRRRDQPQAGDKKLLGEAPERAPEPSAADLAALRIEHRFVFPLPCLPTDDAATRRGEALCTALLTVLRKSGSRHCTAVALGRLSYPGSGAGERLAITQPQALALSPLVEGVSKKIDGALTINIDHPTVQELLPLAAREPELAAYTLLKHCYLGLTTDALDSALFGAALEARWRRQRT